MAIEYLIGSEKEFFDFVERINHKDVVAILTHNDLDGIASAIFLEEILNEKGIKVGFLEFLGYKKNMFEDFLKKAISKKISKVFVLDIGADNSDLSEFEKLRNNFDVFLIDHHPIGSDLKNKKNIIKTSCPDCTSFVIYNFAIKLFGEEFKEKWRWLVCCSLIADYAFKKKENLDFIKESCPNEDIENKNIFHSGFGLIENQISNTIIYFKSLGKGLKKIHDLIKLKNLEEIKKYSGEVKDEISKYVGLFRKEAEFFPEKNLYFCYFNPKFNIVSQVVTILSDEKKDAVFIGVSELTDDRNLLKISARNQSKKQNMNLLIKKGIGRLKNASGGGHIPAAAGTIMKKDFDKFKENLLKEDNKF